MSRTRRARIVVLASLACCASVALAQSTPDRWACVLNGRDLDIRLGADQATVAVGGDTRVLKRTETRRGVLYSDGVVGLRLVEGDVVPSTRTQWIERGQATTLSYCAPATG